MLGSAKGGAYRFPYQTLCFSLRVLAENFLRRNFIMGRKIKQEILFCVFILFPMKTLWKELHHMHMDIKMTNNKILKQNFKHARSNG